MMKKNVLAMLLAMLLLVSLTACGGNKEVAEEEETPVEDVVIEPEVVDPEADVPAEPTEEPDVEPEMPTVGEETEEEVEETPAVTPEEKPEEEKKPEVETPSAGNVDLNAFYLSLVDTYGENFPANMNLCEMQEMLDDFFPGLSDIGTKQMMVYQPMMGAVVCEIALVEVNNASDVEAVKTIMQTRIDTQVEGGAWYPESIEGWKNNSRIVVNGNYVMMIAYSECDAIVDSFNALFA